MKNTVQKLNPLVAYRRAEAALRREASLMNDCKNNETRLLDEMNAMVEAIANHLEMGDRVKAADGKCRYRHLESMLLSQIDATKQQKTRLSAAEYGFAMATEELLESVPAPESVSGQAVKP